MSTARRRFGRFQRRLPVEFSVGSTIHSGVTENLGLGGMLIETNADGAFDAPVEFELKLPKPKAEVRAHGRVLWSRSAGGVSTGLGISFEALRPIDVWALLQYFNLSSAEEDVPDEEMAFLDPAPEG